MLLLLALLGALFVIVAALAALGACRRGRGGLGCCRLGKEAIQATLLLLSKRLLQLLGALADTVLAKVAV